MHIFTLKGSPYNGDAAMEGDLLGPEGLFEFLDLSRPGLEAVKRAVSMGDMDLARASLLTYYRRRALPSFIDPLPKLKASQEDFKIAHDAEKHIFHILGSYSNYGPHDYGPDIDWDANPVDDIEWPAGMHRFHYWDSPITNCYSSTGDERYARLWTSLVLDWIQKNPLTLDRLPFPKSWDAIQVGIRCQRLAAVFPYYLNSAYCTPEFLVELLASVYNHGRRIEQMPYPRNGNFAVIESLGLAYIVSMFPEFREAVLWKEKVMERMEKIMLDQVLADGVHGELCPNYHVLVTNHFLDLLELFNKKDIPDRLWEGTNKMVEVCLSMSLPDGTIFWVGDTHTRFSLRPLLLRADCILNRADFLAAGSEGSQGSWPSKLNYAFKEGGFYSFRSGWDKDAIWLGLHGGGESIQGKNPFHSQYDRGTFELMAFGRILMTDPGVYNYKGGDPDREAFRATSAHQTLTLDGKNSRQAGKCLQWVEDDGMGNTILTIENKSYPDLVHRRTVFFVDKSFFVLVDQALGTASGSIDLHFQLTPGPSIIDRDSKTARTDFPEGGNVYIWTDKDAPVDLEPEPAWFSPRWHTKEELPAFRYSHHSKRAPATFLTLVIPYQDSLPPRVNSCTIQDTGDLDQLALEVNVNGEAYILKRTL